MSIGSLGRPNLERALLNWSRRDRIQWSGGRSRIPLENTKAQDGIKEIFKSGLSSGNFYMSILVVVKSHSLRQGYHMQATQLSTRLAMKGACEAPRVYPIYLGGRGVRIRKPFRARIVNRHSQQPVFSPQRPMQDAKCEREILVRGLKEYEEVI